MSEPPLYPRLDAAQLGYLDFAVYMQEEIFRGCGLMGDCLFASLYLYV